MWRELGVLEVFLMDLVRVLSVCISCVENVLCVGDVKGVFVCS